MIVTRFAPSPTGLLHIGGARTALFNWLFARHHSGKFLLRIEDTDRERSSTEAVEAIYEGLKWLGLEWDAAPVFQSANAARHFEIAHKLLEAGAAYRCYATQEEIQAYRDKARVEGRSTLFASPWREGDENTPPNTSFVIRLKAPRNGQTQIHDKVQGTVTWENETLDDMVLLRADGTPTYMLAVVVDDYDMGITHVIRGDDHFNNAARQSLIYDAIGWARPVFAHIPLIHGPDGKKLSKRHGALAVNAYKAMGYPADAMCNALARLGWSHGDDEFFTIADAIEWFALEQVGRAPAQIDFDKLQHLSGRHIGALPDLALIKATEGFLEATHQDPLSAEIKKRLLSALYCIKPKAKNLKTLLDQAHFALIERPIICDQKAAALLDDEGRAKLAHLTPYLANVNWERDALESALEKAASDYGEKFGKFAGPMRAALSGRVATPSVFDMMVVLGRDESLARF